MWALMVFVQCVNNDAGFHRATCSLTFKTTLFLSSTFCYLAPCLPVSYWWAIVYSPVSALYYVIFHLHNKQSIHFYVVVFFLSAFSCFPPPLLFKQIKRFLLNMQAIVSSPSHDFALPLLHAVLCLHCPRTRVRAHVCVCVSPNICVSTWR